MGILVQSVFNPNLTTQAISQVAIKGTLQSLSLVGVPGVTYEGTELTVGVNRTGELLSGVMVKTSLNDSSPLNMTFTTASDITFASGTVELAVLEFVRLEGNFYIEQVDNDLGNEVVASELKIGLELTEGFVGAQGVGIQATAGRVAILVKSVFNPGLGTQVPAQVAVKGTLQSLSLVGVPGVTYEGTELTVGVNRTGELLSGVMVKTSLNDSSPLNMTFTTAADITFASGTVELAVLEFVRLEGNFYIEQVDNDLGNEVVASELKIGLELTEGFVGAQGVGIQATSGRVGILVKSVFNPGLGTQVPAQVAVKGTLQSLSMVGVPGVTYEGTELTVGVNRTGELLSGVMVKTSLNDSSPLNMTFTTAADITFASGTVELAVLEFVRLEGNFYIEQVDNDLGNEVVASELKIGLELTEGFVGAQGVGIQATSGRVGILVKSVFNPGLGTQVPAQVAVKGTLQSLSMVGVPGVTYEGTELTVGVNRTGELLSGVMVKTSLNDSSPLNMTFTTAADITFASGTVELAVLEFVRLEGNFYIEQVDNDLGNEVVASELKIGLELTEGFVGAQGVGIQATSGRVGILVKSVFNPGLGTQVPAQVAVKGTLQSLSMVGVPGVTYEGTELTVGVNRTGELLSGVMVKTSLNDSSPLNMTFTTAADITFASGTVELAVLEFVRLEGNFYIEQVDNDLGNEVVASELKIGLELTEGFVGAQGVGIQATAGRVAILVKSVFNPGLGTQVPAQVAVKGTLQSLSLVGVPGVTYEGTELTVGVNRTGELLSGVMVKTSLNDSSPLNMTFTTASDITFASGTVELAVLEFVRLEGNFYIEQVDNDLGNEVVASELKIGLELTEGFVGAQGVGIQATAGRVAILVKSVFNPGLGTQVPAQVAVKGTLQSLSLVGVPGVTYEGTELTVGVNRTGELLSGVMVKTSLNDSSPLNMTFTTASDITFASGTVELAVLEFVRLEGNFYIEQVDNDLGNEVVASELKIGLELTEGFVGAQGVGIQATNGRVGILVKSVFNPGLGTQVPAQVAVKGTLQSLSLVGVPGVTYEGTELTVGVNRTGELLSGVMVKTSLNDSSPLNMTFTTASDITFASGTVELAVLEFVRLEGNFYIEQVDNDLGNEVVASELKIGLELTEGFVGAQGVGIQATNGRVGILVKSVFNPGLGTQVPAQVAVKGTLQSLSLVGVPGVTIAGDNLVVGVNRTGQFLSGVTVKTSLTDLTPVSMTFDTDLDITLASGDFDLNVANFVTARGAFGLENDANGDLTIIAQGGEAALATPSGDFKAGVSEADIVVKLWSDGGHAVYGTGKILVTGGEFLTAAGNLFVRQNTSDTKILESGLITIGGTEVNVDDAVNAQTEGEITGTGVSVVITSGNDAVKVSLSGDFGLKKDGGDIVGIFAEGKVEVSVGSLFKVGVHETNVALIIKDSGYAYYASGQFLISGGDFATATGTITVQENKTGGVINSQTLSVGTGAGLVEVTIPTLAAGVFTAEGVGIELEIAGLATLKGDIGVTRTASDIRIVAASISAEIAGDDTSFSVGLTGEASLVLNASGMAIYAKGNLELNGLDGSVSAEAEVTLKKNTTGSTVAARTVQVGLIPVVTPELLVGTQIVAIGSLTISGAWGDQSIGGTFTITPKVLSNGEEVIDIRATGVSIEVDIAGISGTASGTGDFQIRDSGIAGVATIELQGGTEIGVEFNTTGASVVVGLEGNQSDVVAGDGNYFNFNLESFNMNDIRFLFEQIRVWMNELIADTELFNINIPFVNKTLREVVDLGAAWADGVLAKLKFGEMGSLDDFIQAFNKAGLLPGEEKVVYEDLGRTLTIPLSFTQTLSGLDNLPLNFDLDLGDLVGVSTSATASLTASVSGQMTLIVDVDGPTGTEGVTLMVDNAVLTGTAGFEIGTAEDPLQITGRLGFVEITAGGQSGSTIQANATATITVDGDGDPTTTNDRRFTLDELRDQLAGAVHFKIDGSAEATLKGISLGTGLGTIAGMDSAELGIQLGKFKDLTGTEVIKQGDLTEAEVQQKLEAGLLLVTLPDLNDLLSLKNMEFSTIVQMLSGGISWLQESLEGQGFYTAEIPLVGGSLEDRLGFIEEWTARLAEVAADAASTLQAVEQVLESAFGIDDDNNRAFKDQIFGLKLNGGQLVVHLRIEKVLPTTNKTFSLKLGDLLEGLPNIDQEAKEGLDELTDIAGIWTRGSLSVDAAASAVVEIGVDLSDPNNLGRFFIRKYDSGTDEGSRLRLEAAVRGTDLELGLMFPPGIKVGVSGGSAALDLDGNASTRSDNAFLAIGLSDDYEIGPGSETLSNLLNVEVKGRFKVNLPVVLEFKGNRFPLSEPVISVETDPGLGANGENGLEALFNFLLKKGDNPLRLKFPSIRAEFEALFGPLSLLGLLNDPTLLLDGIDSVLGTLEDILSSEMAADVPLIGDKFGQAANFLGEFREGLLEDLREKLRETSPVQLLLYSLNNIFGGLGILQSDATVHLIREDGSRIFGWVPGELIPAEADAIEFDMNLGGEVVLADLGLNLGLDMPGLGLDLDAVVEIKADWELDFGFGVSEKDFFYFKTVVGDELRIALKVNLKNSDGTRFKASGKLMFFNLSAEDLRGAGSSIITANFGIDIVGVGGRLTVGRMFGGLSLSDLFKATFTVDADVQLGLTLTMGGGNSGLPTLKAGLSLTWHWEPGQELGLPTLSLNNIRFQLDEIVSKILMPIAKKVQEVLQPFKPIVDTLFKTIDGFTNTSLPDALTDEPNLVGLINLINYLMKNDPLNWDFLNAVRSMLGFVEKLNAFDGLNREIHLGSINDFLGTPTASSAGVTIPDPFSSLNAMALGGGVAFNSQGVQRFVENPSASASWEKLGGTLPNLPGLLSGLLGRSGGPQAPVRRAPGFYFWDNITSMDNWMKLLKGKPADIIEIVLPELKIDFEFTVPLFKLGPVFLNATGGSGLQGRSDYWL